MAGKRSAGILLFRRAGQSQHPEVLLAHMGGPFWARKEVGAWSIPKGEFQYMENPLAAACREFTEELGLPAPAGDYTDLGEVRQAAGKTVTVWAIEGDLDPAQVTPGTFEMEWPRGSGRVQAFPEIDRVAWLTIEEAKRKVVAGQRSFLDRLADLVDDPSEQADPEVAELSDSTHA